MTRCFALGGLAILLLVASATTAIIISATRSSMASNREIVEVLHFVGATDRFIAREFEKHFLRLGVRAGLVGAIVRHGGLLQHADRDGVSGRRRVTVAELQRLIGTGAPRYCRLRAPGHRRRCHRGALHADVAIRRFPHPQFQALAATMRGRAYACA